jgi:hypothetical protein
MTKSLCLFGLMCLVFIPAARGQRIDLWNDPRAEAEYLAVEITGELRPSVPLADQIEADLAAIRTAHPDFTDIHARPDWLPGELLVGLTPTAYSQFKTGSFDGFDSLYATLGIPETRTHDVGQWLHLQFGKVYHGVRLAELFEPVSGVRYAEANCVIGDGNDIMARLDRTYTLTRGSGDCPAGCIYRESWDFTVTEDGVFSGASVGPKPGDFNDDGVIDTADYVVWRHSLGTLYNETHYATWKSNFGATPGNGNGATTAASVPEPMSGVLLILGLILIRLRCGR